LATKKLEGYRITFSFKITHPFPIYQVNSFSHGKYKGFQSKFASVAIADEV
jgi:hypothetical protein